MLKKITRRPFIQQFDIVSKNSKVEIRVQNEKISVCCSNNVYLIQKLFQFSEQFPLISVYFDQRFSNKWIPSLISEFENFVKYGSTTAITPSLDIDILSVLQLSFCQIWESQTPNPLSSPFLKYLCVLLHCRYGG